MIPDLTGKKLGPFRIEGHLGRGAMGTVYRATHIKLNRVAALKVMTSKDDPTRTLVARFEREIKLLSQFRHPNIVRIYGASESHGVRFYAMELVEGKTLATILEENSKPNHHLIASYLTQVCVALTEIHQAGVVHRDLKPSNLMVTPSGVVKLTDFGIAKDVTAVQGTQITQADTTVGTVIYMSPEQLRCADLTPRSDLYSLGVILYQMLAGRLPYQADTVFDYMQKRLKETFPMPSSVNPQNPPEYDYLVRALMAKEPEERPRDAKTVRERLVAIVKQYPLEPSAAATFEGAPELEPGVTTEVTVGSAETAHQRSTKRSKVRRGVVDDDLPLEEEKPWWESTPALALGLAVVVATAVYMLWPPGPETLFAKGEALMASESHLRWERAFRDYFDPLMEKYPDNPHKEEVAAHRKKLAVGKARASANRIVRQGEREPAKESPAEKIYLDGLFAKRKSGDIAAANVHFQKVVDQFAADEAEFAWVELANWELNPPVAATGNNSAENESVKDGSSEK